MDDLVIPFFLFIDHTLEKDKNQEICRAFFTF